MKPAATPGRAQAKTERIAAARHLLCSFHARRRFVPGFPECVSGTNAVDSRVRGRSNIQPENTNLENSVLRRLCAVAALNLIPRPPHGVIEARCRHVRHERASPPHPIRHAAPPLHQRDCSAFHQRIPISHGCNDLPPARTPSQRAHCCPKKFIIVSLRKKTGVNSNNAAGTGPREPGALGRAHGQRRRDRASGRPPDVSGRSPPF